MITIAIDGPSGAGKSSLAKAIAKRLGIVYVDTGALYRTIGLYMKEHDIGSKDEAAITAALPDISLSLTFSQGAQKILLCGRDVGDSIRTPEISMYASDVSAIGAVRAFLLNTQREVAKKSSVVMDGRDIGTVILPHANCKIFLTASPEARARRRTAELAAKGMEVSYETILAEMTLRDRNDSTRVLAPAVPAEDAVLLDNSDMTEAETLEAALSIIEKRKAESGID